MEARRVRRRRVSRGLASGRVGWRPGITPPRRTFHVLALSWRGFSSTCRKCLLPVLPLDACLARWRSCKLDRRNTLHLSGISSGTELSNMTVLYEWWLSTHRIQAVHSIVHAIHPLLDLLPGTFRTLFRRSRHTLSPDVSGNSASLFRRVAAKSMISANTCPRSSTPVAAISSRWKRYSASS